MDQADNRPDGATSSAFEHLQTSEAAHPPDEAPALWAELIPALVWVAEPDGTMRYVNTRMREFCGQKLNSHRRMWPQLIVHPECVQRCSPMWASAMREASPYAVRLRLLRHDGAYRWCITRAHPHKDASGRLLAWYGITVEIHDVPLALSVNPEDQGNTE